MFVELATLPRAEQIIFSTTPDFCDAARTADHSCLVSPIARIVGSKVNPGTYRSKSPERLASRGSYDSHARWRPSADGDYYTRRPDEASTHPAPTHTLRSARAAGIR